MKLFNNKAYQLGMQEAMLIVFALLIGLAVLSIILKGGPLALFQ